MTEDNAKSKLTLSGKKTLTLKNLSDARPAGDGKKVVQVEVRKKRVINPAAPAVKEAACNPPGRPPRAKKSKSTRPPPPS